LDHRTRSDGFVVTLPGYWDHLTSPLPFDPPRLPEAAATASRLDSRFGTPFSLGGVETSMKRGSHDGVSRPLAEVL